MSRGSSSVGAAWPVGLDASLKHLYQMPMRTSLLSAVATIVTIGLAPSGAVSAQEAPANPVPQTQTAQAPAQTQSAQGDPIDRATFIRQMDAEFARLDLDGSGFVVPEEIIESQRRSARTEALRQNQIVFGQLDANADGVLTPQEFATLANPDAIPVDATPLMSQFDSDKDQVITLVEYRIATQGNFDRIDTDRDGVVTPVEMRAAGISP